MNNLKKIYGKRNFRAVLLVAAIIVVSATSTRLQADTATCGGASISLPFTDVPAANIFFCSIAEAYFSGLTNGTTGTTYSPGSNVTRDQMAAFITRTMDQSLKRGSLRAALNQYWTTQDGTNIALTGVGDNPRLVQSDGSDVWVANKDDGTVSRIRAKDGKLIDTWTGVTNAFGVLCARGKVYVTGGIANGTLYLINPQDNGGVASSIASTGNSPQGIAYDGSRIWTANAGGSVSIIGVSGSPVTTVTTNLISPQGIIYDGANIWVTDNLGLSVDKLKKLDPVDGHVLLDVTVGDLPQFPAFDGTNIWVPNSNSSSVSVVRAVGSLAGIVIATLTGNGMGRVTQIAFDGERMLVTNVDTHNVSLFRASDLTPIGQFAVTTGSSTAPFGACSDGINFWIALSGSDNLARF
jgi:hypothetical protein